MCQYVCVLHNEIMSVYLKCTDAGGPGCSKKMSPTDVSVDPVSAAHGVYVLDKLGGTYWALLLTMEQNKQLRL